MLSERHDAHIANKQIQTVTKATLKSAIVSQIYEMLHKVETIEQTDGHGRPMNLGWRVSRYRKKKLITCFQTKE